MRPAEELAPDGITFALSPVILLASAFNDSGILVLMLPAILGSELYMLPTLGSPRSVLVDSLAETHQSPMFRIEHYSYYGSYTIGLVSTRSIHVHHS